MVVGHSIMTEERGIKKSSSFNFSIKNFSVKRFLSELPISRRLSGDISYSHFMETISDVSQSIWSPGSTGRKTYSQIPEFDSSSDVRHPRSRISRPDHLDSPGVGITRSPAPRLSVPSSPVPAVGSPLPSTKDHRLSSSVSDLELIKEKFSKLLLGEDMSGSGKGVSSALALSNAITNLAASVFGEQTKLEPMSPDRKERWKKEMDWLLAVADYIVEFVPSKQVSNGNSMEIMVTEQRQDLRTSLPGLRSLDTMLIECLDKFKDQKEFWYVSKDADDSEKGVQRDDKWWLPTVKVPPNGLSDNSRKLLEFQKGAIGQIWKASMKTNAQVLSEMSIPDKYIEKLSKHGKDTLGEILYKNIIYEFFKPDDYVKTLDMNSEHEILDLLDKLEATTVIWNRKSHKDGKSWGSGIASEKKEAYEERAAALLTLIKERFPNLPQSHLEISKIENNTDVGHAILESYSRVLESLANKVLSRIEDVLYADAVARNPSLAITKMRKTPSREPTPSPRSSGIYSPSDQESEKLKSTPGTPISISHSHSHSNSNSVMTLGDVIGWDEEEGIGSCRKTSNSVAFLEEMLHDENDDKSLKKPTKDLHRKKFSYADQVESGLRSPTSRH